MLNVDEFVPFLVKLGITANEFLILYLKYLKRKGLMRVYKDKFKDVDGTILTKRSKEKLIKLGYLVKDTSKEGNFFLLGKKFNELFVDNFDAGNEFWDNYPPFVIINKKHAPLMKADKVSFRTLYIQTMGGLLKEHQEIIKDLKYGKKHNLISVNIISFVRSEMWTQIRPLRLGDNSVTNNTTRRSTHEF